MFESLAMQESAIKGGRGIPASKTTIIRTGLDLDRFRPRDENSPDSLPADLGIPADRKVVFYAGHTTPRKGIDTILDSAADLVDQRGRRDVHFLLCGDRKGEAEEYLARLDGTRARAHVTFGGYRDDIPDLMAASYCGVIASTGWDSFPRSAMEMSASGLPLLASALQGLVETVDHGRTGYLFEPGDSTALADLIADLLDQPAERDRLGAASRLLAEKQYSEQRQVEELAEALEGRRLQPAFTSSPAPYRTESCTMGEITRV
ncbi:MAG: glycosyltransferase family 4 protein [Gemmatimonadetes bacterium]|nr:glycosyltransferase family 4 protein [Gemmatimonadota bacterium]